MDTLIDSEHSPQSLRGDPATWRRLGFFGVTLATAAFATHLMYQVLESSRASLADLAGLAIFFVLFTWIAGAFWTAIAGFLMRLAGGDPAALHPDQVAWRPLQGRTAVVLPICNEDTRRVAAGIDAVWSSLQRQPQALAFDLFILSDTRRGDIVAAEQSAWQLLVERHDAEGRLFYRHRAENTGRKSGNLADFVRNWGGHYDYMVVLDADSVMSGEALVALARLMDAHADVGIIQALPLLAGRETLFARLLQFAVRLSGPMFASGLAFWQLGDSSYWGHNAILRLRPFAEHCALPRLSGAAPFGGEILSHDIVEAAFMRRAGYRVWLVPDIQGSWEEVPSNLIDFAARDRRWTQGNLQHLRVLPMRGLHWLSRIHMLTGVLSYVTSPMWLTILAISSAVSCLAAASQHHYFRAGEFSLFPNWPHYAVGEISTLLAMTATILLLPKLLAALLTLKDRSLRHAFGGSLRLTASVLFEQLLSMLFAPTLMLFHTSFVLRTLLGRTVGWEVQARSDRGVSLGEALRRHVWHVLLGLAWGALIFELAPGFLWWILPVVAGLVLAVPVTMLTSRRGAGRALRSLGLLLTPEETRPPEELAAVTAALQRPFAPVPADRPIQPEPLAVPARAPLPMAVETPAHVPISPLASTQRVVAGRSAAGG